MTKTYYLVSTGPKPDGSIAVVFRRRADALKFASPDDEVRIIEAELNRIPGGNFRGNYRASHAKAD